MLAAVLSVPKMPDGNRVTIAAFSNGNIQIVSFSAGFAENQGKNRSVLFVGRGGEL